MWTDEDLKDVLSAKKMVIDGDANVEGIPIGSMQQFIFDGDGKSYPAKIINKGRFVVVELRDAFICHPITLPYLIIKF